MEIKKSIVIKNYLRDLNGYEVAKNYGNGILKIKKGNEYRIIDSDGEDVISTPLKDVVYDNGHFICTNIYGQTGVIDEYGQIIQGVCNCFYKIFDYSKNRILLYDDIDEKFAKLDLNSTHGIDSLDFYSAALRNDMIVGLSRRDGKDIFKTIGNKGNVKEYSFNKWPYNKNISYDILFDDGILVETNNNIFLLDNNGNEVNKVRKYGKLEEISCFNGKIILKKENKLFIVNEDGSKEKYVGCEYRIIDNVLIVYSNINEYEKKYIYTKNKEKYIFDYIKFNDSRYLNFTNGMKHGIFDTVNGKILVKDQDNYLNNVKNDICIIEENGLVGFKNLNTNFELKPKYKLTNDTLKNRIIAEEYVIFIDDNNEMILLDSNTGNELKRLDYDLEYDIKYMRCDVILFLLNGNNYLYNIKTDKKEYIKYSSVSSFYNNYSVVQDEKGRYGIIDSEFNEVVPTLFDSITRVGENYIIDDKLVDIKTFKYEMKLELYSDNNKQLYERKFNKKENLDAAYDYFENEIENYEKKKDKYAYKIENEFSDMFKDEDIRKIKRNVKVK